MLLSGGGEYHGRWGRGRNEKYDNDKENNEDGIHVRGKIFNVSVVGKVLGRTGSNQQQKLSNDKYKNKDKDKDKVKDKEYHSSPLPSERAYI